jgi:N-acyl-D-amino-acid deacylase
MTLLLAACARSPTYDLVLRHGTVYDGTGSEGVVEDVAVQGDSIVALGDLGKSRGREEIDATGLAVAPGFINMLSHSERSLIEDPRSQSEIRQGVTLEVLGEVSMGPLNQTMTNERLEQQGDIKFDITWTTLGGYFDFLEKRGFTPNLASFVGAPTVREYELGLVNRPPTAAELDRMKGLVQQAMEEGAMGVTTALIYTPGTFAQTDELIELAKVAARYGGIYTAHIRSEGDRLLEAIDETIRIAHEADIPVEIYHLKAAGQSNWPKMDLAIAKIDSARAAGLRITADMYNYTAGATGFDASMPPWVQEGGLKDWIARLKDPAIRARVKREMLTSGQRWENLYLAAGSPDRLLLLSFKTDSLKPLTGKTLAEVAKLRGKSPEETAMDLVVQDGSRVGVAYFLMSEDNIRKQIAQPWVAFGSDAQSSAPEGVFLKASSHPRAYGNVARLLGHYVRDERVIPLSEAIRRLTQLPATTLGLKRRGALKPGYFADVAVFDPAKIADLSTYERPQQYAVGMVHVLVNGVPVLRDGTHTGAKPGRIIRGPGWQKAPPPS